MHIFHSRRSVSKRFAFLSWALLLTLLVGGCSSSPSIIQENGAISTPEAKAAAQQPAAYPVRRPPPAMGMAQQPAPAAPSKVKVALLVPLSGKSASLGQAMANAAQLAVFDIGSEGFELMPRDTKGTADGAAQAAREALASGANLVIGPLFAGDVGAVKPVLQPTGISMLALSTDVSLAETGAYVMGFAPAPQVDRVVDYAAAKGLRRFAAIVPPGPYGKLVMAAFENAVERNNGYIVTQVEPSNINALTANKDRIEALFVPFAGVTLRTIAAQLTTAGFERGQVRLLGTGLWDEPNIAEGQALLQGGWFAAPELSARERFVDKYKETYGTTPPRLATLAYDATALAAVLARHGMRYDQASLTSSSGFAGLDGVFRLRAGGQIERGLAVIELTESGQQVIDPSPSTFSAR